MRVRVTVAVSGLCATVLPLPGLNPIGIALFIVGLVAVLVATHNPGSAAPAVVLGAAATSWWVSGPGHATVLVALATSLSVHHTAAAYAAAVPADARSRQLSRMWLARGAATTVGGLPIAGVCTALPRIAGNGLVVALGAAAVLLLVITAMALSARSTSGTPPARGKSVQAPAGVGDPSP